MKHFLKNMTFSLKEISINIEVNQKHIPSYYIMGMEHLIPFEHEHFELMDTKPAFIMFGYATDLNIYVTNALFQSMIIGLPKMCKAN